jgi:hypothetical protein
LLEPQIYLFSVFITFGIGGDPNKDKELIKEGRKNKFFSDPIICLIWKRKQTFYGAFNALPTQFFVCSPKVTFVLFCFELFIQDTNFKIRIKRECENSNSYCFILGHKLWGKQNLRRHSSWDESPKQCLFYQLDPLFT